MTVIAITSYYNSALIILKWELTEIFYFPFFFLKGS